jgi:hypothetical protein
MVILKNESVKEKLVQLGWDPPDIPEHNEDYCRIVDQPRILTKQGLFVPCALQFLYSPGYASLDSDQTQIGRPTSQ